MKFGHRIFFSQFRFGLPDEISKCRSETEVNAEGGKASLGPGKDNSESTSWALLVGL